MLSDSDKIINQKEIFLEWPSVQALDYHTFLKMSVGICYDYEELCSHLVHVSAMMATQILYFVYLSCTLQVILKETAYHKPLLYQW